MNPLMILIKQYHRIIKESRKIKPKIARSYFCKEYHSLYHKIHDEKYLRCTLCNKKIKIEQISEKQFKEMEISWARATFQDEKGIVEEILPLRKAH
jgi:hypothetical protein